MKKNVFAAAVGALCGLLLCEPHSIGQDLSGTNLNVSGTATIAVLNSGSASIGMLTSGTANFTALGVTGVPDFLNNTLYFGTSGTNPALSLIYSDGTSGTNSSITLQSTRSLAAWNWQRMTASGTATTAMQLDASNRLILTGTAASNPPQIVLDPNGGVSVNGGNLLTQTAANALYIPSNAGLVVSNGNVGIGTITPSATLDVAGNLNVGAYSASVPGGALLIIGNGTSGHPSNALTVTASGRLNLFDPSNPTTPTLILDPALTGTSQLPGTVLITPQGDVGMGPYGSGTQGSSTYPQMFPTGINVSGSSAISGKTVVTGTLDLTSAAVLGASFADGGVTTAKLAANAVTTDKIAFDGGAFSGFRNRIINGAFTINQRAYVSGTALAAGAYAHDRWKAGTSGCTYTFTQNKADTMITVSAGSLMQIIEDVNIEGGAFVLSWAGTAQARINGGTYAASPVRVSGLPAGSQVTVEFNTGTVKDVQFESGTTPTPFERRFYGSELAMCQRYYWRGLPAGALNAPCYATGAVVSWFVKFPVTMRAIPSTAAHTPGKGYYYLVNENFDAATPEGARLLYVSVGSCPNANVAYASTDYFEAAAEL